MRLLLDTHIALWAIDADRRLAARARSLIEDPANSIFVSAASIWEIAIKYAISRGRPNDMPLSGTDALGAFEDAGYSLLAVTPAHAAAMDRLPRLHGDPFDRLLVAQSIHEPLLLVTQDARLGDYGSTVLAV